jgi:hypothetical protein
MKIDNQTLKQIIKEELDNFLMEQDFQRKYRTVYTDYKDHDDPKEAMESINKELEEALQTHKKLEAALSKAKFSKYGSPGLFDKMNTFLERVKAEKNRLKKAKEDAFKNLAKDPDAARKALYDFSIFSIEYAEKIAYFLIKTLQQNPDTEIPELYKDFAKTYMYGNLKTVWSHQKHFEKMAARDKEVADARGKADKDIAARRAEIDKIRNNT